MRVAIAHAAWDERRRPGFERLHDCLDGVCVTFASTQPEHSSTWAHRIWSWVARQSDPVCILNDDISIIPRFVDILNALVEALPNENLSLHAQGQHARMLAMMGHRLVRFYDLTGPAYVLWPESARSMVAFWDANPSLKHKKDLNEDNVAAQWAWENQKPFFAPMPALVMHDTSVPSTLGYDRHIDRITSVWWKDDLWGSPKGPRQEGPDEWLMAMADPGYWRPTETPTLIENPWFSMKDLAMRRNLRRGTAVQACTYCLGAKAFFISDVTGAALCWHCAKNISEAFANA